MGSRLKDVAAEANVSIRTAGRALKGGGPVRPEVAERVRAAAEKLAYVPNAAARNLRSRRTRIVGVFVPGGGMPEAARNRLTLLEQTLRDNGLDTLLGAVPENPEELEKILREWYGIVRAIVFLSWPEGWKKGEVLKKYRMRFLFVDCGPEDAAFDRLLTDRPSGVEAAVGAFVKAGRKRIVHACTPGTVGRASGFDAGIGKAGKRVRAKRLECASFEMADGYAAGEKILEWRADAVFFDTDRMALGFYRYAHEHGIRIPEDVSVAGFDNDKAAEFAIPALTTVAHPAGEAIRRAVEIILEEPGKPQTAVYPTRLIERESI